MLKRSAIPPFCPPQRVHRREDRFIGHDRRVQGTGDLGQGRSLRTGHRLLDKARAKGLHIAHLGQRIGRVQALVIVDPEVQLVAEAFTKSLQARDIEAMVGKAGLHLEDLDPFGEADLSQLEVARQFAIGQGDRKRDSVAPRPAQEVVKRHAERLGLQVQEGRFHRRFGLACPHHQLIQQGCRAAPSERRRHRPDAGESAGRWPPRSLPPCR